jgi:hypothetical protein
MRMRYEETNSLELPLETTVVDWMKCHTIHDLKIMAAEMERQGQNVGELRHLIDDLTDIETE